MAKIGFSKEQLSGNNYPEGLYELRLEGFEPELSKKGDSINLNPILKIINHPTLNNKRVFDNLNSGADWIIEAFCHSMGLPLVPNANGGADIPGEFMGPDDKPTEWQYVGPLVGLIGKVMLKTTTYNGKESSKVNQWLCALGQSCNKKHPTDLAK
jgi:hypothetical protein